MGTQNLGLPQYGLLRPALTTPFMPSTIMVGLTVTTQLRRFRLPVLGLVEELWGRHSASVLLVGMLKMVVPVGLPVLVVIQNVEPQAVVRVAAAPLPLKQLAA